jgi:hypothetical protein
MLAEAKSKEKLCVWNLMLELTITSPYVHFRVDSNTFTMGQPYARDDLSPMPESTLSPSQGLWIWPLMAEGAWRSQIQPRCLMSVASFRFPLQNNIILLTKYVNMLTLLKITSEIYNSQLKEVAFDTIKGETP